MRRRYVNQARLMLSQFASHQSALVSADTHDARAMRDKSLCNILILRIFDHNDIALIQHNASSQCHGLLRTAYDQDLIFGANDAAPAPQVLSNRAAQRHKARGLWIARTGAQGSGGELSAPRVKQLRIRDRFAVVQIVTRLLAYGSECCRQKLANAGGIP